MIKKENSKKIVASKISPKTKITRRKSAIVPVIDDKQVEVKEVSNFKDLEGAFLLVNVGNERLPATKEKIEDLQKTLQDMFDENKINCIAFVTDHTVNIRVIK